jgi:hypothetical protein
MSLLKTIRSAGSHRVAQLLYSATRRSATVWARLQAAWCASAVVLLSDV